MDSASFTPDIIQLLLSIGNAKSNAVWESNTSLEEYKKPTPTDTRDTKLKYIQIKYVDRALVSKTETRDPMDILYRAIVKNDIPQALYAIALGANVNQPFPSHTPVIPLLPTRPNSVLKLPILDIDGNEYLDRTMEYTPSSSSQKDFIVRYALHFALLHHQKGNTRPTAATTTHQDSFNDDSCSDDHSDCNCCISSSNSSTSSRSTISSSRRSTSSECSAVIVEEQTRQRVFPMAEFLFQNGADVFIVDSATGRLLADLVGLGHLVDNEAIHYLNMKNSLRGQSAIIRTHSIPPPV